MTNSMSPEFKGCACVNKVQCCGDHGSGADMSPLTDFLKLYAPIRDAKGGIAHGVYAALPENIQAQYPWSKLIVQIGLMGTKRANDPKQEIPKLFAAEFLTKCEDFPDREKPSRRKTAQADPAP